MLSLGGCARNRVQAAPSLYLPSAAWNQAKACACLEEWASCVWIGFCSAEIRPVSRRCIQYQRIYQVQRLALTTLEAHILLSARKPAELRKQVGCPLWPSGAEEDSWFNFYYFPCYCIGGRFYLGRRRGKRATVSSDQAPCLHLDSQVGTVDVLSPFCSSSRQSLQPCVCTRWRNATL